MARPLLELWCVFQADCFSALVELMETAKDSSDDHYVISFSDTCWSWCPHVMHRLPLSWSVIFLMDACAIFGEASTLVEDALGSPVVIFCLGDW
jgi:hypothetical protein